MRILLVDDDPIVVRVLQTQLARLGFDDVVAMTRATDALARLRAGGASLDLILLDLQMPEMDGVEFVRHLGDIGFRGGLILVSGEDERILQTVGRLAAAHRLDIRGSLRKPVALERLRELVAGRTAPAAVRAVTSREPYPVHRVEQAIAGAELVNLYQPKVSVRSGEVIGVETLVRWRHPEDGLVSPDRFVPVAEENGLIDALTHVVLSGAISQARAWLDRGLALKVAINVSMENLTSLAFPDFVAEAVAAAGLAADAVFLEVTESRLMKDPLAALDVLTRLRLKHVGLSIDDFGTGHSSQAQLRDIPFQELKIDRSFVHGAGRDAGLRAMLEANVRMAHQLGMWTVAEGVEDLEDWNLIRELDGDLAQGYFISRPIPGVDIPDWIDGWEERRTALIR